MAFPTADDNQITDSVAQANRKVLGEETGKGMANLYQETAQALENAAHNATIAQQQDNTTAQAATVMGVAIIYSLDTDSTDAKAEEPHRPSRHPGRIGT